MKDTMDVVIYSKAHIVVVKSALLHVSQVKVVYLDMIERLKAGNKASALNLFFGHARQLHDTIFTSMGANLASFAAQGGSLSGTTAMGNSAEVTVIRIVGADKQTFMVYLMRGEDGIWRIESM